MTLNSSFIVSEKTLKWPRFGNEPTSSQGWAGFFLD